MNKMNKMAILMFALSILCFGVSFFTSGIFNRNSAVSKSSSSNQQNKSGNSNGNENTGGGNQSFSKENSTLVENVQLSGYGCAMNDCSIFVYADPNDHENRVEYLLDVSNNELVTSIYNYQEYVRLNLYYVEKNGKKVVVGYQIFLKFNDKDISNVKDENELRDKIGVYSVGTHTEILTLTEVFDFVVLSYTFVNENNVKIEMEYEGSTKSFPEMIEGKKYKVTFEVTKDDFRYQYVLKSIKKA